MNVTGGYIDICVYMCVWIYESTYEMQDKDREKMAQ